MHTRLLMFLVALSVILIPGCAEPHRSAVPSDTTAAPAVSRPADTSGTVRQTIGCQEGQVTLRDAIACAIVNSPRLRAFSWEIHAAEANRMQAALPPNPELEVGIEEFGGTGARRGFDASETTIQVGQFIELAQKRSKRIHLASLEKQLAHWDYQAKRLDVIYQVATAFVDVLAAQERLDLAKESLRLTEQTYTAVAQRVDAGKDSPLEETKAKVSLSTTRMQSQAALQDLESARTRLAATWGATDAEFDDAVGQLHRVSPVPDLNDLEALIPQNPDVARRTAEEQRYRAALDLEKAKATSDPAIRGGLKQLNEGNDTALIIGIAIPIPMFDRNQAGIRRAIYAMERAAEQQRAAEIEIHTDLAHAAGNLATAFAEATVLADDIVPAAQNAFDAATHGYQAGKFDYLDVLDAQRTLFDAKDRYLSSLVQYHKARAHVERLIGGNLDSVKNIPETKENEN
ncbi:MAG: TolC family protein [Sedimentisphaerales bacterium]|nr:TolC family protein [Sedimentisphaerales bacterium]